MKYIVYLPEDRVKDGKLNLLAEVESVLPTRIQTGIPCEPYTEPDRKAIEDEVWEFASRLMNMHPDVAEDIYWSMNGGKGIGVAAEMTYQEAKTAYNAWKNRNICVGDEVIYDSRTKAVVLIPETKERYGTILTDDFATIVVSHDDLEKTGRHFDDIAELLKKMSEE